MNLFLSVCCMRDLNIYRALPPVTFESLGILLLSVFHLLKNSKQTSVEIRDYSENNKDLKGQGHLETSG